MKTIRYCFYLIIIIALLFLATLNSQAVVVHYYWGDRSFPLSLLILLILALGCLFGLVLGLGPIFKLRKERSQWRRQVKNLQKQVAEDKR